MKEQLPITNPRYISSVKSLVAQILIPLKVYFAKFRLSMENTGLLFLKLKVFKLILHFLMMMECLYGLILLICISMLGVFMVGLGLYVKCGDLMISVN